MTAGLDVDTESKFIVPVEAGAVFPVECPHIMLIYTFCLVAIMEI